MKKALLVLGLSIGLMACRSRAPHEGKVAKRQTAEISTREMQGPWGRAPAGRLDVLATGNDFQKRLHQLVRLFYLGEASLQEFDAELDRRLASHNDESDLLKTSAYARLLAAWTLSEDIQDELETSYLRLWKTRGSDRESALRQMSFLHKALSLSQGVERIAFSNLYERLVGIQESHTREWKPWEERLIAAGYLQEGESALPSADSWKAGQESGWQLLAQRALESRNFEDALSQEWTELAAQLNQILNEVGSSDRQPQTLRFFPSPGAAGNIVGSEFDTGNWALTFDDGPSRKYTPQLLSILKQYGVPVTFFWLSKNVTAFPDIVKLAKEQGLSLQNHSHSHVNLAKASTAVLDREIVNSTKLETKAYGVAPRFFRTPYGSGFRMEKVRSRIVAQKMIHVFWSVDSLDWQDKNPRSVLARVQKQMKLQKRGVILFHDIHPQSVEASRLLLEWIKKENQTHPDTYRLRLLSDIVDEMNGKKAEEP